jgi:hypothetical protein
MSENELRFGFEGAVFFTVPGGEIPRKEHNLFKVLWGPFLKSSNSMIFT